ncbi:MAG: T9SS type A sorting domain-containing protein [Saprospiraceae bacterium]
MATSIENQFASEIKIFPNSVSDRINFSGDLTEVAEITIFSNLGKTLIQTKNISEGINVSSLPSGIYYVRLSSSANMESIKKIVIQN